MDSHKTVSTNHSLSEEKGEPKRYRTEVLPLQYQPNALAARPNRLTAAAAVRRLGFIMSALAATDSVKAAIPSGQVS